VGNALQGSRILVVGRGSGIARAVTLLARSEGGEVVVAGRDEDRLAASYDDPGVTAESLDIARGTLPELQRTDLQLSLDTKVLGPLMFAKYFAPQMNTSGSFVLFSGIHAFKAKVGYLSVGITNGAVDFLARYLAVELAPIRVNAVSPGVIDTGAWDAIGEEGKRAYFEHISAANPVGRIGTAEDVAQAVVFAMTNTFMTGVMLKIDG
jgi:NAD(P)-dependent dehydrogenase (short-subunit alcohol dehydrogenase family)